MAEFYEMPAISPTMEVGTLVEWKIQEGEAFEGPKVIADIGTDKATMEAEIFEDGVLIKHLIAVDDEIPPGFPMAIYGASADEDISDLLAEFEKRKAALDAGGTGEAGVSEADVANKAAADKAQAEESSAARPAKSAGPTATTTTDLTRRYLGKALHPAVQDVHTNVSITGLDSGRVIASPLARSVAKELGVNLKRVTGSGPGGRIVREDVESAAKRPASHVSAESQASDTAVKNNQMRRTIAKRLLASSQDIPVFYLTASFDMQGFVDLRKQLKAQLPDVKVSYNDILIKAVAAALRKHPEVNAQWTDKAIIHKGAVDIGVAVALPDGLITPVVRSADQKSLSQIGSEVRELAGRARDGKLAPEEYTGGTFTISNLGMFAIDDFTAIINPPEAAILAVGSIQQVPVAQDGALAVGWRMKVTMSCDHRVIDGAVGATFLATLRTYIENPYLLLV